MTGHDCYNDRCLTVAGRGGSCPGSFISTERLIRSIQSVAKSTSVGCYGWECSGSEADISIKNSWRLSTINN